MRAIEMEYFQQHCADYHKFRDAGFEEEYEVDILTSTSYQLTKCMYCSPWLLDH